MVWRVIVEGLMVQSVAGGGGERHRGCRVGERERHRGGEREQREADEREQGRGWERERELLLDRARLLLDRSASGPFTSVSTVCPRRLVFLGDSSDDLLAGEWRNHNDNDEIVEAGADVG